MENANTEPITDNGLLEQESDSVLEAARNGSSFHWRGSDYRSGEEYIVELHDHQIASLELALENFESLLL